MPCCATCLHTDLCLNYQIEKEYGWESKKERTERYEYGEFDWKAGKKSTDILSHRGESDSSDTLYAGGEPLDER
jgi:hypothetical protein